MFDSIKEEKKLSLVVLWRKCWGWKWILIISAVGTGILSMVVSLILPDIYSAEVTILAPEAAVGGGLAGGLMAAAAQGLGKGQEISSQTILALLKSGGEAEAVIKRFNIAEAFGLKNKADAYKVLDKITAFSFSELEGVIRVTVETHSPELSANMANFYVKNLNTLNEKIHLSTEKPLVKVIDWAGVPSCPSKPRVKWNTVIGGFLGFIISFLVLYIKDAVEEFNGAY